MASEMSVQSKIISWEAHSTHELEKGGFLITIDNSKVIIIILSFKTNKKQNFIYINSLYLIWKSRRLLHLILGKSGCTYICKIYVQRLSSLLILKLGVPFM